MRKAQNSRFRELRSPFAPVGGNAECLIQHQHYTYLDIIDNLLSIILLTYKFVRQQQTARYTIARQPCLSCYDMPRYCRALRTNRKERSSVNRESGAPLNVEKSDCHHDHLAYEKSHGGCLSSKERQSTPAIIDLASRMRPPCGNFPFTYCHNI